MTTLPQAVLAKDPGIVNTAYRHTGNNVGAYARALEVAASVGDRVVIV